MLCDQSQTLDQQRLRRFVGGINPVTRVTVERLVGVLLELGGLARLHPADAG